MAKKGQTSRVVLPYWADLRKIVALTIIAIHTARSDFAIDFGGFEEMRGNRYWYLLDVNGKVQVRKYQDRELGSAAAVVCEDYEVTDPVLLSMAELMSSFNRKSIGRGLNNRYSIFWVARKRALMKDVEEMEFVDRAMFVVSVYHNARSIELELADVLAEEAKEDRVPDYFEGCDERVVAMLERVRDQSKKQDFVPFSISGFLQDVMLINYRTRADSSMKIDVDEALGDAQWWIDLIDTTNAAEQAAFREARELDGKVHTCHSGIKCINLVTSNPKAGMTFTRGKGFNLVLIQNDHVRGRGFVLIADGTYKPHTAAVLESLREMEKTKGGDPAVWWTKNGAVYNHTPDWPLGETVLKPEQVWAAVKYFADKQPLRKPVHHRSRSRKADPGKVARLAREGQDKRKQRPRRKR